MKTQKIIGFALFVIVLIHMVGCTSRNLSKIQQATLYPLAVQPQSFPSIRPEILGKQNSTNKIPMGAINLPDPMVNPKSDLIFTCRRLPKSGTQLYLHINRFFRDIPLRVIAFDGQNIITNLVYDSHSLDLVPFLTYDGTPFRFRFEYFDDPHKSWMPVPAALSERCSPLFSIFGQGSQDFPYLADYGLVDNRNNSIRSDDVTTNLYFDFEIAYNINSTNGGENFKRDPTDEQLGQIDTAPSPTDHLFKGVNIPYIGEAMSVHFNVSGGGPSWGAAVGEPAIRIVTLDGNRATACLRWDYNALKIKYPSIDQLGVPFCNYSTRNLRYRVDMFDKLEGKWTPISSPRSSTGNSYTLFGLFENHESDLDSRLANTTPSTFDYESCLNWGVPRLEIRIQGHQHTDILGNYSANATATVLITGHESDGAYPVKSLIMSIRDSNSLKLIGWNSTNDVGTIEAHGGDPSILGPSVDLSASGKMVDYLGNETAITGHFK